MISDRFFSFSILILLLLLSCCFGNSYAEVSRLSVYDSKLIDESGRQVFLWGMNMGEKSSRRQHESWHGPEDFHNLRRWGMNAVRFLIFWSAVEPEPGRYDEKYLERVDNRIGWAQDAGLYVILDMHQDLWSEAIPGGNGAPAWATLDDDMPHQVMGGPWSTAYFTSPRIHRAFDNFWDNASGPNGVGIQDRLALAWQHVAKRYADEPTVAGFDLMNEPFPGSPIRDGALAVWRAVPDIFRGADMPNGFLALLASLNEKPYPKWLLNALDEPVRHRRLLQAVEPMMQQFEQDKLMAMYQRTHHAVRKVNSKGIFFLEPLVMANTGVPTFIEPLMNEDGSREPLQAYMPHAYDIVLDTNLAHQPSQNRLDIIFSQKQLDAERLNVPLLIGEWGAFYGDSKTRNAARMSASLIESMTSGAFYWDYHRHIDEAVYFECLARPQPLALAGTLEAQSFDPDSGRFQCSWNADPAIDVPSLFAAPKFWSNKQPTIEVTPDTLSVKVETHPEDMDTVYVVVATPDEPTLVTLTLQKQ